MHKRRTAGFRARLFIKGGNMSGWLTKDINDLMEQVNEFCNDTECGNCPFNKGRNVNCLKDNAYSLTRDHDLIERFWKGLEQYV